MRDVLFYGERTGPRQEEKRRRRGDGKKEGEKAATELSILVLTWETERLETQGSPGETGVGLVELPRESMRIGSAECRERTAFPRGYTVLLPVTLP